MADRQAKLDALIDKQEIWECLVAMCRGTDRCDRVLFLSGYHADAVVTGGPFVGTPADLYDWAERMQREAYTATFHNLHQMTCELDGDQAHVETYYFFVGCMADGNNVLAGGRYTDRFERRDGRWGMVMRNTFVEWTCVVPAAGSPLGEIPGLELNGLPARDRSDASYIRPLVNRRPLCNPG